MRGFLGQKVDCWDFAELLYQTFALYKKKLQYCENFTSIFSLKKMSKRCNFVKVVISQKQKRAILQTSQKDGNFWQEVFFFTKFLLNVKSCDSMIKPFTTESYSFMKFTILQQDVILGSKVRT